MVSAENSEILSEIQNRELLNRDQAAQKPLNVRGADSPLEWSRPGDEKCVQSFDTAQCQNEDWVSLASPRLPSATSLNLGSSKGPRKPDL